MVFAAFLELVYHTVTPSWQFHNLGAVSTLDCISSLPGSYNVSLSSLAFTFGLHVGHSPFFRWFSIYMGMLSWYRLQVFQIY